ncbi:MAG: LysR substrate-binding domain-containing protein [Alphaproteobacteria bacterium]
MSGAPLPSHRSLQVFEAVVRNRSVGRAAAELGITQPAASQQLRQLERLVGRALVRRTAAGIAVDETAELYAARIREALDALARATAAVAARPGRGGATLTVSLLATLAQRWLIPRLAGFQEAHPEIEARLLTTSRPEDVVREDVDLSIRCGRGRWRGMRADFLMANGIGLAASPALVAERPVRSPADLAGHALIRIDAAPRDRDWAAWLDAAGVAGLQPRRWLTFSTSAQAVEAAIAGLGIAISHQPFVADAIAASRLVRPLPLTVPDPDGDFYLVAARDDDSRKVRAFRRWLLAEVGG